MKIVGFDADNALRPGIVKGVDVIDLSLCFGLGNIARINLGTSGIDDNRQIPDGRFDKILWPVPSTRVKEQGVALLE